MIYFQGNVKLLTLLFSSCLFYGSLFTQQTDQWRPGNPSFTKRSEITSTLSDQKIYVLGGIKFLRSCDEFEVYDIEENKWKLLPSFPLKINHAGMASDGTYLYVTGGSKDLRMNKRTAIFYKYHIETEVWERLADMPGPRTAHQMIYRAGELIVLGGRLEQQSWVYSIEEKKWRTNDIPPFPVARDHFCALLAGENLYIVGGRNEAASNEECWKYDFKRAEWVTFTRIPLARGGQTAILYENEIHVIGGEELKSNATYDRHDVFNFSTEGWEKGVPYPVGTHGLSSEMHAGTWYVFGGATKAGAGTIVSTSNTLNLLDLR